MTHLRHLRRLIYSASISAFFVASLTLLADSVPELLLFLAPGIFIELILTTFQPFGDGEAFGYTHHGWAANQAFYFLAVYLLFSLFQALQWFYRELQAEPHFFGPAQSDKRL